jgi:hypothetical protein
MEPGSAARMVRRRLSRAALRMNATECDGAIGASFDITTLGALSAEHPLFSELIASFEGDDSGADVPLAVGLADPTLPSFRTNLGAVENSPFAVIVLSRSASFLQVANTSSEGGMATALAMEQ